MMLDLSLHVKPRNCNKLPVTFLFSTSSVIFELILNLIFYVCVPFHHGQDISTVDQ